MSTSAVETLLRKDRAIVAAGLAATTLLAWLYLLTGAGTGMDPAGMTSLKLFGRMAMPMPMAMNGGAGWSASYWLIMLAMWWVMMIAMMLPSAAPAVLLYARVCRHSQKTGAASAMPTAAFVLGYLVAWLAFSAVATALQAGLERVGLLDRMMMWSTDRTLTAAFLLAAGIFQLSPLKSVCLDHCRTPVDFLTRHWRQGTTGAMRMGLHHGLFCVGCCWLLMALLFAGGVMNLIWIAALTIFVLVEKLAPHGGKTAKATGLLLIAAAAFVLLAPATAKAQSQCELHHAFRFCPANPPFGYSQRGPIDPRLAYCLNSAIYAAMSAASPRCGEKFIFGCGPAMACAIRSASKPYLRPITSNGGALATSLRACGAMVWQAAQ